MATNLAVISIPLIVFMIKIEEIQKNGEIYGDLWKTL